MKQNFFNSLVFSSLLLLIALSSCKRPGQEIFTVVPDHVAFVGSFNPGNLMEKGNVRDIQYIKTALGENEFTRALFENPEMSGIKINDLCGFFYFGTEQKYLGVVMPLKKQKDFENFLDKLGEEYDSEFIKEKAENFTYAKNDNNVLAWNKSLVIHLTLLSGWDETAIESKVAQLFSLEDENCVLSDKDFKSFLSQQKDLNLWVTSNQISSLTGKNMGALNMLGAVNNNYAHIFLEFRNGAIVLSSNLELNPDFKKNFDKFNIIDLDAEKQILKMLPATNLILAGNFRLNPAKLLEIINSFNSGDQDMFGEFENETGKKPEEVLKSVEGSMAFSINGVKSFQSNPGDESIETSRIPVMVAAIQLNDEQIFKDFIRLIEKEEEVREKNGYYLVEAEELPFYLLVKNNIVVLSNEEKYVMEIMSAGELKNNILSLDISKTLINNPICLYLNLDKDSYTEEMNGYLKDEMDERLAMGLEGLGTSLQSMTLLGNIEKTELRIEFKDKSQNSLYALLKSMEF